MECYRGAMLGEQTFEGRRENLSLIDLTATVQSLGLGSCGALLRTLYERHVRTQSNFEMGARRSRIFVSEVSARSYLDIRRRPYDDGDGRPSLSRQSGECRPRGGIRRFTLELSHASMGPVMTDVIALLVRVRAVGHPLTPLAKAPGQA